MASLSTVLQIKMTDGAGDPWQLNVKHVDDEAATADVKALVTGLITNGAIFEKAPTTAVSAQFVTTEVTDVDLS